MTLNRQNELKIQKIHGDYKVKITILKYLVAFIVGLGALTPAAFAQESNPVGKWHTVSGESRYEVTTCRDGKAICAKLVWLRADMRSEENLQFLNKTVLSGARPVQTNKWRGAISFAGEKLSGSLTLVNPDRMRLNGCNFVFCRTVNFKRI